MAIQNLAKIVSNVTSTSGEGVNVTTLSNISEVVQVDVDVTVVKTASKSWVLPEGEVTLVTTITNNSNSNIEDIRVQDTLAGATFVAGSVKVGSIEHPSLNPVEGFDVQVTLGAGADMSISYTVKADKLPTDEIVKASSAVSFKMGGSNFNLTSNEEVVEVIFSGLTLLKTASPTAVVKGTEITYTVDITNDGTRDNVSVTFSDALPAELSFVAGSITIDGAPQPTYTLENIPLNDLSPGDSVTVTFRATVN